MQRIHFFFFSVGAGKAGFLVLKEQVKSSVSVQPSYYPNNTEADVTISYSMNQLWNDNTGYSLLGQIWQQVSDNEKEARRFQMYPWVFNSRNMNNVLTEALFLCGRKSKSQQLLLKDQFTQKMET